MLFKTLTADEVPAYKQWARENYKVFSEIRGIWHPEVQAECVKMNAETGYSPRFDLAMDLLQEDLGAALQKAVKEK